MKTYPWYTPSLVVLGVTALLAVAIVWSEVRKWDAPHPLGGNPGPYPVRPFVPCKPFEYTEHVKYCPKCNNYIGSIFGFTESWVQDCAGKCIGGITN